MASKVASKLVKPPLSFFGIEGRYVNALYSAASKQNALTAVEGDLKKLSSLYKTDHRFKDFMINPLVSQAHKNQAFGSIKEKLKLNTLSVNLLSVMAEHKRLKHLPEVENAFAQVMAATRNEIKCTVTTAKALTDAKKKEVEDSLKAFTTKKLLLNYEVDPTLVGGMVVDFNGEHYIDMSVKSKFRLYSECISNV